MSPVTFVRRAVVEPLEHRCLLSVTLAEVVGDTSFVEGVYSGELRLKQRDDQGRRNVPVTLVITNVDPDDGAVRASIDGDNFDGGSGDGAFGRAPRWSRHLQIEFTNAGGVEDDSDGVIVLDAHFANAANTRIEGALRDGDDNSRIGKIQLNRTGDAPDNGTGGGNGGGGDDNGGGTGGDDDNGGGTGGGDDNGGGTGGGDGGGTGGGTGGDDDGTGDGDGDGTPGGGGGVGTGGGFPSAPPGNFMIRPSPIPRLLDSLPNGVFSDTLIPGVNVF